MHPKYQTPGIQAIDNGIFDKHRLLNNDVVAFSLLLWAFQLQQKLVVHTSNHLHVYMQLSDENRHTLQNIAEAFGNEARESLH